MSLESSVDIAIVGGGPAGCSAALTAARLGASVTLIDENEAVGGHLRWTLAIQSDVPEPYRGLRGDEIALRLAQDLKDTGVSVRCGAVIWGLFSNNALGIVTGKTSGTLHANSVVIATGATDIVFPFPGWQLPGVMTATAVLKALHLYRVRPGSRAIVLGAGEFADTVAHDLALCGVPVITRSDSVVDVRASGGQQVENVMIGDERFDADLVVLAFGHQPDAALAQHVMCDMVFSSSDGVFVPRRDATLMTSCSGVYAVGECAEGCTLAKAWAEGHIAACAALFHDGPNVIAAALIDR